MKRALTLTALLLTSCSDLGAHNDHLGGHDPESDNGWEVDADVDVGRPPDDLGNGGVIDDPFGDDGDDGDDDLGLGGVLEDSDSDSTLSIGFIVHVEAWNFNSGWDDDGNWVWGHTKFLRYATKLRRYSKFFRDFAIARHVAPFVQWEVNNILDPDPLTWDASLIRALQRSGAVGLHADILGPTTAAMTSYLSSRRTLLQSAATAGSPLYDVSGICSERNWARAAIDSGFTSVTGIVDYCEKALPVWQQSTNVRFCTNPGDCHDPWGSMEQRVNPWRASQASQFHTHDPSGELILIPGSGEITCLEEALTIPSPGGPECELHVTSPQGDLDEARALIDEALLHVEPGKLNQIHFTWSFGRDHGVPNLNALLSAIHTEYVDTGRARWSTIDRMVERYQSLSATNQEP